MDVLLKKLVCKRVEHDDDPHAYLHLIRDDASRSSDDALSNASPRPVEVEPFYFWEFNEENDSLASKVQQFFSRQREEEPLCAPIQHEWNAFPRWEDSCNDRPSEDDAGSADRTFETDMLADESSIVQDIQKSWHSQRSSKKKFMDVQPKVDEVVNNSWLYPDTRTMHRDTGAGADASAHRPRWMDQKSMHSQSRPRIERQSARIQDRSNLDLDHVSAGAVERESRQDDLQGHDEYSLSAGSAQVQLKSLLRKKARSRTKVKKKTRFADVLEERHFLPPSYELQGDPWHILTCTPDHCAGKSILRPPTPQNYRYYMPSTEDTNRDDMAYDEATTEEFSTMSNTSDEKSFFSTEFSVGSASQASMETLELLYTHIFCSADDRLISRDWLR